MRETPTSTFGTLRAGRSAVLAELPTLVTKNIPHFTGRDWLLPVLLDWLDKSSERVFLLIGQPGSGKTSLTAWLAGAGPLPAKSESRAQLDAIRQRVNAVHFCSSGTGRADPRNMARSIASQLTETVPPFGKALAATVVDRVEIRGEATVKGDVGADALITAVNIRSLTLDHLGGLESFNRVLRDPLRELYANGFDQPILLLVDSLDESVSFSPKPDVAMLLAEATDFPEQVRIMATTRPDQRLLKFYPDARHLDLIEDMPADDVRDYVEQRLAGVEPKSQPTLATEVVGAARGNFLYAHLAVEYLLEKPAEAPREVDFKLPSKLGGLYQLFLNRELGRDEDRWTATFAPILGLIAVAQEPGLSLSQIEEALNRSQIRHGSGDTANIRTALRICSQYLDGPLPDGPFRVFHNSLTDFLFEDKSNFHYLINPAEMHRLIVARYQGNASAWNDVDWRATDEYGLRYLPLHLAQCGLAREQLPELLTSFPFLEEKTQRLGIDTLMIDLRSALDVIPAEDVAHARIEDLVSVLDRETENLRRPEAKHPTFFAQQVRNRAVRLNVADWVARAAEGHLGHLGRPYLQLVWATGQESRELRRSLHHDSAITTVAVTPDQRKVVSAGSDSSLYVWDFMSGRKEHCLVEPSEKSNRALVPQPIIFAPDGRSVTSGSGYPRCWDLQTGGQVGNPFFGLRSPWHDNSSVFEQRVLTLVLPDSTSAITARRGRLILWDLKSGSEQELGSHEDHISALCVRGDGRVAASASHDGLIKLWDLASGSQSAGLADAPHLIRGLALTPDGKWLISTSTDDSLKIWDLHKRVLREALTGHDGEVNVVAVLPDGRRVISGSDDGTMKVWDVETGGEEFTLYGHTDSVTAVTTAGDGRWLVSGSSDKTVKIWQLPSEPASRVAEESAHRLGHRGLVLQVAVSPNGGFAITGGADRFVRVWSDLGLPQVALPISENNVESLAVTADGSLLLCASCEGTTEFLVDEGNSVGYHWTGVRVARSWQLGTWQERHRYSFNYPPQEPRHKPAQLMTVTGWPPLSKDRPVLSSDGRYWLLWRSGLDAYTLSWIDLRTGQPASFQVTNTNDSRLLWVSPDGRRAVLTSSNTAIDVLDFSLGLGHQLTGHGGEVFQARITPCGRYLVTNSKDNTIRIWQTDPWVCAHVLEAAGHNIEAIAQDGRRMVSVAESGELTVWDIAQGRAECSLPGLTRIGCQVDFANDDRWLVTVVKDRALRVWDTATWQELAITLWDESVSCFAAIPGGMLVLGHYNGCVGCLHGEFMSGEATR